MGTTPTTRHVDLAPPRRPALPYAALLAGLVALVLSFAAWDWFSFGGIVLGIPAALVALGLGLRAREADRRLGTAAVVLAVVVLLIPVAWTIASAAS